jgi:putative membrane protein
VLHSFKDAHVHDKGCFFMRNKIPHLFLWLYLVEMILLGIHPYSRSTWFAENLPIWILVGALVATYPRFQFSNSAYAWMMPLILMHTLGGHFTFERVPFDWVTEMFGFDRNHFDRIAHFSVGFYAYPMAELLIRKKVASHAFVIYGYPASLVLAWAGLYEIIEWVYAAGANPEAGAAFLGSQGDIWDAQKDMLADGLGAIPALIAFSFRKKK